MIIVIIGVLAATDTLTAFTIWRITKGDDVFIDDRYEWDTSDLDYGKYDD